jgi:hypothetical protein
MTGVVLFLLEYALLQIFSRSRTKFSITDDVFAIYTSFYCFTFEILYSTKSFLHSLYFLGFLFYIYVF